MDSALRIFLIDPHPAFRQAMRRFLHGIAGVQVVGEQGTVAGAIPELYQLHPDIILCDPGDLAGSQEIAVHRLAATVPMILLVARSLDTWPGTTSLPVVAVLDKAEFGAAILPLLRQVYPTGPPGARPVPRLRLG